MVPSENMFDVRRLWGGGDPLGTQPSADDGAGAAAQTTESEATTNRLQTLDTAPMNDCSTCGDTASSAIDDYRVLGHPRVDSPPPPLPAAQDLFTLEFPRPSDLYERRMSTLFENPNMTVVVRGCKRPRKPRPRPSPRKPVVGPPVPDIQKAIDLSGKTAETVASEMGVPVEQLEDVINERDPHIGKWAPVLAKCTRLARVGLLKLVSGECPCGCNSAGHHIFLNLKRAGDRTVTKCRDHLTQGWRGWTDRGGYRLTDTLVDNFFAGQSKEAEKVADFLFRLAKATDKTNIFCIFVK